MNEFSMVSADELNQIEGGLFHVATGVFTVHGPVTIKPPPPPPPPTGAAGDGGGCGGGGGLNTIDGRDWFQMD